MTATVSFPCPSCRSPLERPLDPASPAAPCERCGAAISLRPEAIVDGRVVACPACGNRMLYQQKDFRQAIGCLVVLIAAALAPFTWYLSLVAAAIVDFVLYRIADEVVICYRVPCRAHVRGVAPDPRIVAFDLSIHDHHRALARREAQGLAGPDDSIGPPLDARSP